MISGAELVGGLWLDALRMTIISLVFSLLVTGVATAAATAALGGIASRALLWFGVLLLTWVRIDPADTAARRASVGRNNPQIPDIPPLSEWMASLIPTNPVSAAAEGAVLQVVVFSLVFGLAVTRLAPDVRGPLIGFF